MITLLIVIGVYKSNVLLLILCIQTIGIAFRSITQRTAPNFPLAVRPCQKQFGRSNQIQNKMNRWN